MDNFDSLGEYMVKYYVLMLLLLMTVVSGCIISDSENTKKGTIKESYSEKQGLSPIVTEKLDTGQELRIYRVVIGSDICYVSEIVNANHIVTSGGMSCG